MSVWWFVLMYLCTFHHLYKPTNGVSASRMPICATCWPFEKRHRAHGRAQGRWFHSFRCHGASALKCAALRQFCGAGFLGVGLKTAHTAQPSATRRRVSQAQSSLWISFPDPSDCRRDPRSHAAHQLSVGINYGLLGFDFSNDRLLLIQRRQRNEQSNES